MGLLAYYEHLLGYESLESTNGGMAMFVIRDALGTTVGTAAYSVDYQRGRGVADRPAVRLPRRTCVMTALRIVLLIVVAFVVGCGIGAAALALWAYWETER